MYGIDTSNPVYTLLLQSMHGESEGSLLEKINQIKKELKQPAAKQLPGQIALVEGYMLLESINDSFQLKKVSPKPVHWGWFVNETQKRNHSILAHGFVFVSKEQYKKFKAMVESIFDLFCQVEEMDIKECARQYQFIEDPFNEIFLL
ncbi:hypothetical protein HUE98_14425 [Candidatus Contubernalis alkalaceticus]|nr:hypothetical protein HUE98_14425 [Candidatus Contubernalis alkalaceticus]